MGEGNTLSYRRVPTNEHRRNDGNRAPPFGDRHLGDRSGLQSSVDATVDDGLMRDRILP